MLVRERISADGPLPYAEVVELALYHREHGFYASGGHAGRRGDFITSPEVGPLFGHVVANALDVHWNALGRPGRFVVIDYGAGPGTLVRSIRAAEPACGDALELVAIERSEAQRALHPDGVLSLEVLDDRFRDEAGCIIANELLDNLPFNPVWRFGDELVLQLVAEGHHGELVTRVGPVPPHAEFLSPGVASGVDQSAAATWLKMALSALARGRVIVFDYAREQSDEVQIRTYAQHGPAGDPLVALGTKDITVDLDLFQLKSAVKGVDTQSIQADWLSRYSIGELVDEGKRQWATMAASGGLQALRARSRVAEAEALTDPTGLGAFIVAEWAIFQTD